MEIFKKITSAKLQQTVFKIFNKIILFMRNLIVSHDFFVYLISNCAEVK